MNSNKRRILLVAVSGAADIVHIEDNDNKKRYWSKPEIGRRYKS